MKRKAGVMVVQGEMAEFPNFPIGKMTVKFITLKSARGHSYRACELRLEQLASKALPAGEVRPKLRAQDVDLAIKSGRPRRAGRDPRLPDAVAVG
jgi:hypothetical protein